MKRKRIKHKWQIEAYLSDRFVCIRCKAGPYTRTELHNLRIPPCQGHPPETEEKHPPETEEKLEEIT